MKTFHAISLYQKTKSVGLIIQALEYDILCSRVPSFFNYRILLRAVPLSLP